MKTEPNGDSKYMIVSIKYVIDAYLAMYGSYNKVGAALDIDPGNLHRIHKGKTQASEDTARKLGLRKHVIYTIEKVPPHMLEKDQSK